MRKRTVAASLICLLLTGCSSTYETLKEEHYSVQTAIDSSPPGLQAYYKTKYIGKTPTVFKGKYKQIEQKITFGGYRLGLGMLITGGIGIAVGGGMVGGGAALGTSDGGVPLIALGAVGAIYGLIGVGYGAVAMIGSPGPRIVKKTNPSIMKFGIRTKDGKLIETKIVPLDKKIGWIDFKEIKKVKFEAETGQFTVEGLRSLKKVD